MTRLIAGRHGGHTALAPCIRNHVFRIILQARHRSLTRDHRCLAIVFTDRGLRAETIQIRQRPAGAIRRNLQPETHDGFQQHAFCLTQTLPYSPISRLTEVSALGMFQMCLAGCDRNTHICDLRADQHAAMRLFRKMRQDQALPVAIQYILADQRVKDQTAAPRQRFHQQLYFRVVAQRLIMADPQYRLRDRFFI